MEELSQIKVSVVVPVYNAEKYLEQCLDSIVNQTLKEIEIICVDDGSTDASVEIVERYAEADDRISLVKQTNQYAGVARNNGMKKAKGKYLVFWDSDDYFMLNALEVLYTRAEETAADVCACPADQYNERLEKIVPCSNYLKLKLIGDAEVFNMNDFRDNILQLTSVSVWNKLFRREFVESNNLEFQAVRNANDVYFMVMALCLADRISYVDEPLVVYRKNDTGLSAASNKNYINIIKIWIDTRNSLIEKNALPERSFANKALATIIGHIKTIATPEIYNEYIDYLNDTGLAELGLIPLREEEYYFQKWQYDALRAIISGDVIQVLLTVLNTVQDTANLEAARKRVFSRKLDNTRAANARLKEKNAELKEKLNAVRDELNEIKRIFVVRVARKVKKILK